MKKIFLTPITVGIVGILFFSCKQNQIALTEPSEGLTDSISLMTTQEVGDSISPISQPASKGLQWKAWEEWFKDCPENQTFKKNIVYLGAASSKGVGYILSRDMSMNRWDLFKINNDTSLYKTFLDKGVEVTQCDLSKMADFSFDMLADGNFLKSVNADLGALIQNAKSITVKSGTWRIESIDTGPFMAFINSSKDSMIQQYREALLDKKILCLPKY